MMALPVRALAGVISATVLVAAILARVGLAVVTPTSRTVVPKYGTMIAAVMLFRMSVASAGFAVSTHEPDPDKKLQLKDIGEIWPINLSKS